MLQRNPNGKIMTNGLKPLFADYARWLGVTFTPPGLVDSGSPIVPPKRA